ncbi:hypothetical protein ACFL41_00710 [Gemmatimonadota bacterium]
MKRTGMIAVTVLCLLVTLLAACSADPETSYLSEAIDQDGIRCVLNGSLPTQQFENLRILRYEDLVTIGLPATDQPLIARSGLKGGVAIGPGGSIGYGEYSPSELRVFNADGSFLWRAGREGEGPGEFSSPMFVDYSEAAGWTVFDLYRCRICSFTDDGISDRTLSYVELPDSFGPFYIAGISDRRFWYLGQRPVSPDNPVRKHLVYLAGWNSLAAAEVFQYPVYSAIVRENGRNYKPVYPQSYGVNESGHFWLNHTLEYQIEVFDPDDGEHWRIRRDCEARDYEPGFRRRIESTPISERRTDVFPRLPDQALAIADIIPAANGLMWVINAQVDDSPERQVDVFTATGEYLSRFWMDDVPILLIEEDYLLRTGEAPDGSPLIIKSRYWLEDR